MEEQLLLSVYRDHFSFFVLQLDDIALEIMGVVTLLLYGHYLLDCSFYIKLHALGASDLVAVKVCAVHVGESETILIRNFPTQQFFKARTDGNSKVFVIAGLHRK